jgi:hypothetical protein
MSKKKQGTLGFGSKSSSSNITASQTCTLTQANKTSLVTDPVKFFNTRHKRSVPSPTKDGSQFKCFTKDAIYNPKPSGRRTLNRLPETLIEFSNRPVKTDVGIMKQAREIISTNANGMTVEIGNAVHKSVTKSPVAVYNCMPCLQMREALLLCEYTQVKDKNGNVIGVRAPCPCCETNEFTTYSALRVRPLDDVDSKSVFVDVKCECRNLNCKAVKKIIDAAKISSSSSNIDVCYSFSNVHYKLIHKLYPPVASSKYPFIERKNGGVHSRLRRSFFPLDSETDMHSKLAARYQDYYRVNTLPLYLEIVQKYNSIQRRAFPVPDKTTPSPAMSIGKMKAFIEEMWKSNDREMIVRHISSIVPEHTLITDYTFEVARLLDDSKCCCIVLN